jgi:hypothetical protein
MPSPAGPGHQTNSSPNAAAHDLGGTMKGGDCHVSVLRVEKAADLAPACLHAFGKAFSRKVLCLHCLSNLTRQQLLNRDGLKLFEPAFFFQKLIQRRQP